MDDLTHNTEPVKPAARESFSAENDVEIAQPMNDVFSISFESKFDPYFSGSHEQGGAK